MPFQPVVDVAQVVLEGRVDSQMTINDLYFMISGGGITPVNLAALVTSVRSWWIGELIPNLSDDWTAVRVIGVDLTTVTGPRSELATVATGGMAGEANPNNVAACVSIRTAQRGRSARGRNYVPAVPSTMVTLNTMDEEWMAAVIDAYTSLVGAGTFVPGWEMVVVSRFEAGAARAAGLAIPVTGVTFTSNSVRSMRSREVGHGA